MEPAPHPEKSRVLVWTCWWTLLAVLSFQAGHTLGKGAFMVLFIFAALQLSFSTSWRSALYPLLLTGLLCYGSQLRFFWTIFGAGACILWLLLAMWLPLFGVILHIYSKRFNQGWLVLFAPVLWTGLEYFRSEIYGLRFTWLTLGSSFWATPASAHGIGVYGLGFLCVLSASLLHFGMAQRKIGAGAVGIGVTLWLAVISPLGNIPFREQTKQRKPVHIAGLQLEFPKEAAVLNGLDGLIKQKPDAQLLVLSEYTFPGPIPIAVRDWCKRQHRYLVAGGTKPLGGSKYYNMAYVIGPGGKVVFEQAKSRPIQFFKDGSAAQERRVWHSPWGPIGILICFDLSYAKVTDDLVAQGAQLLLAPTMDVAGWGLQEHQLNGHTAPLRAAEYGIPIFRLCSSGISEVVDPAGNIRASSHFPGQGEIIDARILMTASPGLPLDRILAPLCALLVFIFGLYACFRRVAGTLDVRAAKKLKISRVQDSFVRSPTAL